MKLNPKHVVSTLVHDGRVLVESSLIIKYIDDAFPEPPMRPADAAGRYAVDHWIKRVDEELHPAAPTPRSCPTSCAWSTLATAIIREHLATKGLGLHHDLQNESSIVGNFPFTLMMLAKGTPEQKEEFLEASITGERRVAFGLTEPEHGSDATHMDSTAVRDGSDWILNAHKRWNTGMHHATHDMLFVRTSGKAGDAGGISCFLVPADAPGIEIGPYWWTLNMPTDHPDVKLRNVRVPGSAMFGEEGRALELAQMFVHENRIRQAASSLGAAPYCINEAAAYARVRAPFGVPLWKNQAIEFPLAELQIEAEMLRVLIRQTS